MADRERLASTSIRETVMATVAPSGETAGSATPIIRAMSPGTMEPVTLRDDAAVRWADDHCHLPEDPAAAAEVVAAAGAAGVERLITVGCDVAQSRAYLAIAADHVGRVWATAGVHPHEARFGVDGLEDLLAEPGVVAVGECGLDYHYDHSPRADQRAVFAEQIGLARRHDLALVIHTREAWDDTFAILAAEGVPERTVFHCFSGGPEEARRCLDLGAHLSFSGIVTFPSAGDLRAAAAICPSDRYLVETDSPYLAPIPHRGRKNQPAWVVDVGAGVAAARQEPVEVVAEDTWRTTERVYRLT
jgi:TatD DNase family protein